jgi:Tfp pilus assembly protein PilP
MKWLHLQRRLGKSEVREPGPRHPWCLGVTLLLSLLIGGLVGGGSSQEPPGTRGGRPTAPPPPVQKTQEPADDYRYNVQGRRDPLDPLVKPEVKPVDTKPKCAPGSPLEKAPGPLERFDFSALKLVGIVWGELGRKALIKAPDGKSYFATVNTYMGKYCGKVIAVQNDQLVIEELYVDAEGKEVPKTLNIPLRRKDKKEG